MASVLIEEEYTGIDRDKEIIAFAKLNNAERWNAKFYSLEEFENKNYKFDTVILSAVIEHLDYPVQTLMELKKHLNDGGRMIITTPSPKANKILSVGSKFKLFSKEALEEHKDLLSKSDFLGISKKIGLKLEQYETFEFGLNQLVVYKNESKI